MKDVLGYNPKDSQSIDNFAKIILGRSLRQVSSVKDSDLSYGRGDLGSLVEKFLFRWTPPSTHGPDFPEAGLELKVTGVKKLKNKKLVPKERLVLSMVDYMTVVTETFEDSYLWKKCKLMLILFYLYELDVINIDRTFLAKKLWEFPETDIEQIKNDWETIVQKIKDGKAHELSEGDTFYLGACTKASDSTKRRKQPFSSEQAKPRAFSLKPRYMKIMLEDKVIRSSLYENFMNKSDFDNDLSIEEKVAIRVSKFKGQKINDLFKQYGKDINPDSKNKYALLTNRLLGIKKQKITEFEKAGILIRTVRLNSIGTPEEDISFPYFKYLEIVDEEWEESPFKDMIESKFLFIILQKNDSDELIFKNIKFWNMPYPDRLKAKKVWQETISRIRDGKSHALPSKKFSEVAHVRPHGRNSKDVLPTPQGKREVKKCFWLNSGYIKKQLDS